MDGIVFTPPEIVAIVLGVVLLVGAVFGTFTSVMSFQDCFMDSLRGIVFVILSRRR
jgi:drug/metabolite transporter (DMT)-like permease